MGIQIHEGPMTPNRLNMKRATLKHIIIKLPKVKDKRILKAAREKKQVTYKGTPIRQSVGFSTETLQARREWDDTSKILKEKTVNQEYYTGASPVAQWLRICLLMQGTRVRALVWEDPTCCEATRPVSHNYWACTSGACAPQQERPR